METGQQFPRFFGVSHEGQNIDIYDYKKGKNLVLFFFPRATTAGCVRETTEFAARMDEFTDRNTEILGLSVDDSELQKTHAIQCAASFPILSDRGGKLIAELGIANERGSAKRTTYIVDAQRNIKRVFTEVKVDGHVDEVLEAVKGLSK